MLPKASGPLAVLSLSSSFSCFWPFRTFLCCFLSSFLYYFVFNSYFYTIYFIIFISFSAGPSGPSLCFFRYICIFISVFDFLLISYFASGPSGPRMDSGRTQDRDRFWQTVRIQAVKNPRKGGDGQMRDGSTYSKWGASLLE